MDRLPFLALALAVGLAQAADGQRRFRIGPAASLISLEEGLTGTPGRFSAFGGTIGLLTGQDAEVALTIARYGDLSSSSCTRSMTFAGLESIQYPVGAGGLAPFASIQLGLARVLDEDPDLLFGACLPAEPSTQIGYGFGLGLRVNIGGELAGMLEGRFFQLPESAIQALEARVNLSATFGAPRAGDLLAGAVGPAASFWLPVGGSLRGRTPFVGLRFRRDNRKGGTLALQVDYAPLEITRDCSQHCEPYAILFAPAYEPSLHAGWGRFYGSVGALLAGFPGEGPDRGAAQGAHGGIGADIFAGTRAMVNLNARLVWLRRAGGENVFGVQVAGSVSRRLTRPQVSKPPPR